MFGNHLTGIYEKAFDPRDSWEVRLRKAKELAFDFLELSIDETDERIERLYWDKEKIESLRRASYEAGMPIQSMCLSAHRRFPFGSKEPEVRNMADNIITRAIDFAFDMGIRVIQLAGYDVYYEPSTPESVKLFKEGLVRAAKYAERKQVMLAMEIMDTPFMNSIIKHLGYEKMIGSPWYKLYPDMGNLSAWSENDPSKEIVCGMGSIVGVHVKDTIAVTNDFEGKFKGVSFGQGCVNFSERFAQLEKLGYTGPYMVEMWYADGMDDKEEINKAMVWLQRQYEAAMREVNKIAVLSGT